MSFRFQVQFLLHLSSGSVAYMTYMHCTDLGFNRYRLFLFPLWFAGIHPWVRIEQQQQQQHDVKRALHSTVYSIPKGHASVWSCFSSLFLPGIHWMRKAKEEGADLVVSCHESPVVLGQICWPWTLKSCLSSKSGASSTSWVSEGHWRILMDIWIFDWYLIDIDKMAADFKDVQSSTVFLGCSTLLLLD